MCDDDGDGAVTFAGLGNDGEQMGIACRWYKDNCRGGTRVQPPRGIWGGSWVDDSGVRLRWWDYNLGTIVTSMERRRTVSRLLSWWIG